MTMDTIKPGTVTFRLSPEDEAAMEKQTARLTAITQARKPGLVWDERFRLLAELSAEEHTANGGAPMSDEAVAAASVYLGRVADQADHDCLMACMGDER